MWDLAWQHWPLERRKGCWLASSNNLCYHSLPTPWTSSSTRQSSTFHFPNQVLWSHPNLSFLDCTPGTHPVFMQQVHVHDLVWPPWGEKAIFSLVFTVKESEAEEDCRLLAEPFPNTTTTSPHVLSCLYPCSSNKISKNKRPIEQTLVTSCGFADKVASYIYLLTLWHHHSSALETQKNRFIF